jgi:hypothetical protein
MVLLRKTRKTHKKTKQQRRTGRRIRGGCGCNNNALPFITGGNSGGDMPPPNTYYRINDYVNDPQHQGIGSRTLDNITGGRRRKPRRRGKKTRKIGRRLRKMSGGGVFDPILGSTTGNAVLSAGTVNGAFDSYNILKLDSGMNPAVYSQPVSQMYNDHNAPLV